MRLLIVLFLDITTATTAPATDTNAKKVDQLFAGFEKPGSPACSVGIIRNSSFAAWTFWLVAGPSTLRNMQACSTLFMS